MLPTKGAAVSSAFCCAIIDQSRRCHDHPGEDIGLKQNQNSNETGESEAVKENVAQDRAGSRGISVATLATTMLCASIIFPITPPEAFAAAVSKGGTPI